MKNKDYCKKVFSEELEKVLIDDKVGYISKSGKVEIEPKYIDGGKFKEGLAPVQK